MSLIGRRVTTISPFQMVLKMITNRPGNPAKRLMVAHLSDAHIGPP